MTENKLQKQPSAVKVFLVKVTEFPNYNWFDIANAKELTPSEIELLKFELRDRIDVLSKRDLYSGFTDSKNEIDKISEILKKLESMK